MSTPSSIDAVRAEGISGEEFHILRNIVKKASEQGPIFEDNHVLRRLVERGLITTRQKPTVLGLAVSAALGSGELTIS